MGLVTFLAFLDQKWVIHAQGVCRIQELGICIIDAPSNSPRQKVGVLRAEYEEEVVDVELDLCLVVENVH
jgi:hypothetical protein